MLLGPLAVLASKVTRVSVSEHGESREIVFSLVENKSAQVSQDDQWTVAGPDAALAYVVLTDVLLHLPFVDLWEGLTELGTTENDVCTPFFLEDVKDIHPSRPREQSHPHVRPVDTHHRDARLPPSLSTTR